MTKPANQRRGEVALNEAGDGIVLRFTMDAMERLHSEFDDDYIDDVIKGMQSINPKTMKMVIEVMAEGGEPDLSKMPWGLTFEELNTRVLDAIFLSIHGRTFHEHQQHLEELQAKEWEEAKENPQKAARLLSKQYSERAQLQGSGQTKSANTRR